jgi:cytoskeleton protein RodZ
MSADSSLGAFLRQGRERSGLSVDAVASACRIAPQVARALEDDHYDVLPAPVYVRGFIRAYCQQVGLDVDEALRIYDPIAAATPAPSLKPVPTAPAIPPRPTRRWRRAAAGAAALVALGVATFVVVRGREPDAVAVRGPAGAGARSPSPAPLRTSPAPLAPTTETREQLAPPSSASPAGSAAPAGGAPSTPAAGAQAPGRETAARPPAKAHVLLVRAVDTTWLRIAPDGAPATEETLPPGAVREWRSAGRFRVSVGNAGGIVLELDGQPLPALGEPGQVVHATIPGEARP